jgi:hypothetical protein
MEPNIPRIQPKHFCHRHWRWRGWKRSIPYWTIWWGHTVHRWQSQSNIVTYVNLIFSNMTNAPSFFSGEDDFTHVTQDRDHGASSSQRITMTTSSRQRGRGWGRQHHLAPTRSTSSIQSSSEDSSSYAHGYPKYLAPDLSTVVHEVQWVYEWESIKFYSMLVSECQTTSTWIEQTWDDYKTSLMSHCRFALMSINDYHMANFTWMMPQ